MRQYTITNRFEKDVERAKKRNWDISKLFNIIQLLCNENPIPNQYRNHRLKGKYSSYYDIHVESDWILIYYFTDGWVHLVRTGSYSDLFGR
ncbi:MAG: type II toxin-antitoxin system YafQ family toxin [Deltaproteobacteria bacterium]|jgi:mRNA interferase YafQ|nr:type II toxin-antitoxin system YafQ family toxin [Deltaproteobacteria bacterium]